tara:strand:- start:2049 stop:2270 length:222 start_codon:yes stop_codon:yes gene_type:complete
MIDPRPIDDPQYFDPFYGVSNEELAQAYIDYFSAPGTSWFTAIFHEAQARGLTLEDLEEIHYTQFDPPCSLDY